MLRRRVRPAAFDKETSRGHVGRVCRAQGPRRRPLLVGRERERVEKEGVERFRHEKGRLRGLSDGPRAVEHRIVRLDRLRQRVVENARRVGHGRVLAVRKSRGHSHRLRG